MGWLTALAALALALPLVAAADGLASNCGTEFDIEAEPFLASLQNVTQGHVCTATLLTVTWLLTAAQCIVDKKGQPRSPGDFFVLMGSTNVERHPVGKKEQRRWPNLFVVHPMFSNVESIDYDLALIRLQTPMELALRVSPVSLPKDAISLKELLSHDCTVVGWTGRLKLRTLEMEWRLTAAHLKLRDASECMDQVNRHLRDHVHLCTHCDCQSTCHGGSGSALMCQGVQVGLVSFLMRSNGHFRGVYSRVDTQLPWLLQLTSDAPSRPPWLSLAVWAAAAGWLRALCLAFP